MKKSESNEYFMIFPGKDQKLHKYILYLDDKDQDKLNEFIEKLNKSVPIKECLLNTLSYFRPIEESKYDKFFNEPHADEGECVLKIDDNNLELNLYDSPCEEHHFGSLLVNIEDSKNIKIESYYYDKYFLFGTYKEGEIPPTILSYPESSYYFDEKGDNYLIKTKDQDIYLIDKDRSFTINYKSLNKPNYFSSEESNDSLIKEDSYLVEMSFSSTDDNFLNRMDDNLVSNYFKAVLAGEISNLDASKALKNELYRQTIFSQVINEIKKLKEAKDNYEGLVGSDISNINNSLTNLRCEAEALEDMKNGIFYVPIKEDKRKKKD